MTQQRLGAWLAVILGTTYFLVPLYATLHFSRQAKRDLEPARLSECAG